MPQLRLGTNPTYQLKANIDAYGRNEPCDCIAIWMGENGENFGLGGQPTWQLDVYAQTDVGKMYVGTINTVAGIASPFYQRVIAYAVCPGARAWNIEAMGPIGGPTTEAVTVGAYTADLRAIPSRSAPNGLGLGVYRPGPRYLLNGVVATAIGADSFVPLASSRIDYTYPIAFAGAFGSNETAARIWIMFFDLPLVPTNGAQPVHGLSFDVAPNGSFSFTAPINGIFFQQGMSWAASSTAATLTQIAPGPTARVTTLGQW